MMLLATASYALYGVLTKRWAIALPNWQSLYVQILFGVLLLLPNFLMAQDVGLNGHNLPLVLFAGIPASIIAPFLWIRGVMRPRQHRLDLMNRRRCLPPLSPCCSCMNSCTVTT